MGAIEEEQEKDDYDSDNDSEVVFSEEFLMAPGGAPVNDENAFSLRTITTWITITIAIAVHSRFYQRLPGACSTRSVGQASLPAGGQARRPVPPYRLCLGVEFAPQVGHGRCERLQTGELGRVEYMEGRLDAPIRTYRSPRLPVRRIYRCAAPTGAPSPVAETPFVWLTEPTSHVDCRAAPVHYCLR